MSSSLEQQKQDSNSSSKLLCQNEDSQMNGQEEVMEETQLKGKESDKDLVGEEQQGNAEKRQEALVLTSILVKLFSRDILSHYFLLGLVVASIWLSWILQNILDKANAMAAANPQYAWPVHSDFLIMFASAIALGVIRYLMITYLPRPLQYFIKECPEHERYIRSEKMTNGLFKALFFICSVTWAYSMFAETEWFGSQMGGSGDFKKIWVGFPYYEYPSMSKIYYMVSFSYHFQSLIFHVFISEPRSDYMEMLLHHTVTCFLLYLSFVLNYLRVGICVLVVHDVSDIFVYLGKLIVDCKYQFLQIPMYIALMSVFGYTRLYVFPVYVIPWGTFYAEEVAQTEVVGWDVSAAMLIMLEVLHIYWFFLLAKMGIQKLLKGKSGEDVVSKVEVDQKELTAKELIEVELLKEKMNGRNQMLHGRVELSHQSSDSLS